MKRLITVAIICLAAGFLIGKYQGPEKVEVTEKVDKQSQLISDLQKRIKSLTEENLKESVKTVTVEKPDGTKVTTRTRNTEKNTSTAKLSDETEKSDLKESLKSEVKTVTTFSSNHNAIGIRPIYRLPATFDVEGYLKAGTQCFIFECFAEGSYAFVRKEIQVNLGIEKRF